MRTGNKALLRAFKTALMMRHPHSLDTKRHRINKKRSTKVQKITVLYQMLKMNYNPGVSRACERTGRTGLEPRIGWPKRATELACGYCYLVLHINILFLPIARQRLHCFRVEFPGCTCKPCVDVTAEVTSQCRSRYLDHAQGKTHHVLNVIS
jgi:hypothetical protein